MSNIVLLTAIVLTCISTKTAAQVVCVNPIQIGELRVLKSKQCVDIDSTEGRGNIGTHLCDGHSDQQIIMCDDGTIRNSKSPHNCFTPNKDGHGNLMSTPCEVYPAIPDYQKWKYGRSKTFEDKGGIQQEAKEIRNVKSGQCMDVANYDGYGNIGIYDCQDMDDQYFYFRSRGKLLGHGRLQVEKSGLCLDVHGYEGRSGVQIYNCETVDDQYFKFYENGELVNKKSGLCVDIANYGGHGDISMYACEDLLDQMWTRPHQYCHGDYCSFRSKKSGQCIDVAGYEAAMGSNVATYDCEGAPDQRFRWTDKEWVTPTATWSLVGCNQNGKVTHSISNTISYKTKIATSISSSVSATIEAGVEFGVASASLSVTTSISASLAKEWENSQSETKAITFTCQSYDTGKPFVRGCMWQLQLTTWEATIKKVEKNDILTWSPEIIKCTSNAKEPQCPPFTRCVDDACTMCENLPGVLKKKSVDESLTWKKLLKIN